MTEKQLKLVNFIKTYMKMKGVKPTQKACAEYMKVSQPAIARMLKRLP